ncbi:hypothetical protein K490DRAFT_65811 [Saccharata proteae CBS 121410]|uniref:Uncharacterized protein n=1 Tax=Saccharata proteae CBS 121410 TaxID=1314787 RepID=A0A9P4HWR2_9PEZI|nr:hypothetical protein K490DRAFT_65811 [Saccharata proteae CBS 121410]
MAMAAISSLDAELARNGNGTDQQMTDLPNDAASTPKSASVAPSVSEANKRATITLMFGDEERPDNYNIASRDLEKLPQSALDRILASSHVIGGPDRKIYQYEDYSCSEMLLALKKYLRKGDWYPPTRETFPQASDAEGNNFTWFEADDGIRTKAVGSTDASHGTFLKEVRMYSFTVNLCYPELRKFVANKICNMYPIFVREALVLLDQVYHSAFELKDESLEDRQMYETIMDSVQKHRAELIRLPKFLNLLRKSISHEPLGRMLLDFYIDATSDKYADALRAPNPVKMEPNGSEHDKADKAEQNGLHLNKEVVQPPTNPVENRHMTPASRPEPLCYQLPALVEALENLHLMVAVKPGFGTLIRGHSRNYSRNNDFRYQENELLIYLDDGKLGKNNFIVQNARGEIGDIVGRNLHPVPPHLHVTDHFVPVHCGRPLNDRPLIDRFSTDNPPVHRPSIDHPLSDRPLIDRFDREQRMNEHFSPRTTRGRSRSRSPRRPPAYENPHPYRY